MRDFQQMSTKEVVARYKELRDEVNERKSEMWDKLISAMQNWESCFGPITDEEEFIIHLIPNNPGKIDYNHE